MQLQSPYGQVTGEGTILDIKFIAIQNTNERMDELW